MAVDVPLSSCVGEQSHHSTNSPGRRVCLSGWTEDQSSMAAHHAERESTVIDFAGHVHPEPTAPDGVKQLNQYVDRKSVV